MSAVVVCCIAVPQASAGAVLVGMESGQFETDLVRTDDPTDVREYTGHSSYTAVNAEWQLADSASLSLALGTLSTIVEDYDPTDGSTGADGMDGGALSFIKLGFTIDHEVGDGSVLVDISHIIGRVEWKDAGDPKELNSDRTAILFAYAWGDRDGARLYAGAAYRAFKLDDVDTGVIDKAFEEDVKINLVVGARVHTPSFSGFVEGTMVGGLGARVGLAFGF